MSIKVVQSATASRHQNQFVPRSEHVSEIFVSEQISCKYAPETSTIWTEWTPRGIPSFNQRLLHELHTASQLIEASFAGSQCLRLDYIAIRSGVHGVFNVGGDLGWIQELIANQDRARLTEYARAAVNVIYRNYTSHNLDGVTTIALLEGDALGGGFECALSCDVVIAERHVKAGFPEVLFNMFPGMGGMSFLARRTSRNIAEEMVRSGRQYTATELLEFGVIDQVVDTGDGVSAVQQLAATRQRQRGAHAAMNRVNRLIRPVTLQELDDVVTVWVDCALTLSPYSLEWMQRLYQRQLTVFTLPIEKVQPDAKSHHDARSQQLSAA